MHVDLYFDYLSPYAYFAWTRLPALCAERGVELRAHPILFAALLGHHGHRGPAEIPPKRVWVMKDAFRWARANGVPISGPRFHPFNPLTALRLSLREVAGDDQHRVIDAIWRAGWGELAPGLDSGIDLGSADDLVAALDRAGLDGRALLERTRDPAAKDALKRNTAEALSRGAFWVPTMLVGDELFWGNDSLQWLALHLDGHDPLDQDMVERVLARPSAVQRG